MWSRCPWLMKALRCRVARWGHRPRSKATFLGRKETKARLFCTCRRHAKLHSQAVLKSMRVLCCRVERSARPADISADTKQLCVSWTDMIGTHGAGACVQGKLGVQSLQQSCVVRVFAPYQRGSMMQVSSPATDSPSSSTPATVICPSRAGFCRHRHTALCLTVCSCSDVHWPAICQQRVSVCASNSSSPSLPCRVASASGVHTCLLRGVLVATSAGKSAGAAASAAGACVACGIAADMLPHAATGAWGRQCCAMYCWLETRVFLKPRFS